MNFRDFSLLYSFVFKSYFAIIFLYTHTITKKKIIMTDDFVTAFGSNMYVSGWWFKLQLLIKSWPEAHLYFVH